MAKRKKPDPAITDRWVTELRQVSQRLGRRRRAVEEAELELENAVQGAFAEGVLVGPMKEATGLSGSRLYQLKFAKRDREKKAS